MESILIFRHATHFLYRPPSNKSEEVGFRIYVKTSPLLDVPSQIDPLGLEDWIDGRHFGWSLFVPFL